MIQAIYFDYHGVLDRRDLSLLSMNLMDAAGQTGVTIKTDLAPMIDSYVTSAIAPNDFWNMIQSRYGDKVVRSGKSYVLHVDPVREIWELLNTLNGRCSIGLFTDCPADKKDVIVHAYNLPDFFDQLLFSCDARQSKIDPNFYRRMLRDGLYQPAECMLIDHSRQVVDRANMLGFVTHQFVDVRTLKKYLATNGML